MAAPTAPTAESIVTEALKRSGDRVLQQSSKDRAEDQWLEEVKNEIVTVMPRIKSLQSEKSIVCVNGQNRYSFPTDYAGLVSAEVIYGNHRGTAQAGDTNQITLKATEDISEMQALGREVYITSGTGHDSSTGICDYGKIISYNESTKVASVSPPESVTWGVDGTSKYLIGAVTSPLKVTPLWDKHLMPYSSTGKPQKIITMGRQSDEKFDLWPTPYLSDYTSDDNRYVIKLLYYTDLMELDLTSTLLLTLYKKWRNLFIQGVYVRALDDNDDDKYQEQYGVYQKMIEDFKAKERPEANISTLQVCVIDY